MGGGRFNPARWAYQAAVSSLMVAICPHGLDPNTSAEFAAGDTVNVSFIKTTPDKQTESSGDKTMSVETVVEGDKPVETPVEDKTAPVVEGETPVETPVADSETKEAVVEEPKVEGAKPVEAKEASKEETPEVPKTLSVGETFLKDFGEALGGKWFALGKTHGEATKLFVQHLSEENAELKQRLASLDRGAKTPLSFSESNDSLTDRQAARSEIVKQFADRGESPGTAALAATLQMQINKLEKRGR
jgi:hypothetical protein